MAHVRERPSLRESSEITTPSGKRYRWADDESAAENVPSGERWSDSMPGGHETHDATLPRKPGVDYSDLERLSNWTRYDASGGVIWDGRLERAPRVSGDQIAISPSAVGWQAHLEDDKSARVIYRDIDLTHWGPPAGQRKIVLITVVGAGPFDPSVVSDATTGAPAVVTSYQQPWAATARPWSEAWYDAGAGVNIGSLVYVWKQGGLAMDADTNALWQAFLASDDIITASDQTGSLRAVGPGSGTLAATGTRRYAGVQFTYAAVAVTASPNAEFSIHWTTLAVYGDHGLTNRGTEPNGGFYDADIIGHAISQWCPMLNYTTESLSSSGFVIPHLAFLEPTTTGEIVRQATRFGLRDWAVWDDRTFWLHDRGARGRRWRARVGPSGLEETGSQVDRLWESVIVAYQDVDGSTRTVGPVGSGADTESADLHDDDPENPANKLGITRRDMLTMGISTAAGATEIGARFLEQSKLLDSSGRAKVVGFVEDDRGITHPYSHIRSGDYISFVDAADTGYRRIVHTDKSRDDRTCSFDLDAPPEGLQALLERLGVVLVPLGL